MRTDTLERIRIAPNRYGVSLMRQFERNSPFAAPLADVLQRECETGSRALYLGLVNGNGELLARTRLVVDSLRVVIVDELEAVPGQDILTREILRFAADEASVRERPLAVLAPEDDTPEWADLGFADTGCRVLAL